MTSILPNSRYTFFDLGLLEIFAALMLLITSSSLKIFPPLDFFHDIAAAKSLQSCPTLCDPIDGSPLGSSVPGIL